MKIGGIFLFLSGYGVMAVYGRPLHFLILIFTTKVCVIIRTDQ